jgi:Asp-tRNA(Asn)/Glu-tRNA(Gln) amidotransferase A subunit family amidase
MKISEQLEALRLGSVERTGWLDTICDLIEKKEEKIRALVNDSYNRSRVLSEADRLLQDFPNVEDRPSLFGLPLGVKDIFRVDGFSTRCGSKLLPSLFEGAEASSVTRLKEAGAIIVGKTATTEFACFQPGPTRNPYNLEHTPGGSSSGSAAGVSMGFFPLALGTQTAGSIVRPAAYCGVVGFKPSFGRIATDGVVPLSPSLDHVGFFCSDISGLSIVAAVLISDWETETNRPDMATVVAGIPEGPYLAQTSRNAIDHFDRVIGQLKANGVTVVPCRTLSDIAAINECHTRIMLAEMARVHGEWYSDFKHLYAPITAEMIQKGLKIDNEELKALITQREANRQQIIRQMDDHGIDFWLTPAATDHAPKGLSSTGNPIMNLPWTHAGMPTVSIPCGVDSAGLPHGLQLVGRFYDDEVLVGFSELIDETITETGT